MNGKSALVISGEPILRLGLRYLLTVEAGMSLVGDTADVEVALRWSESRKPSFIVLGPSLLQNHGFTWIRDFHRCAPLSRILVLSSVTDAACVQRAFACGALGYVTTEDETSEVLAALASLNQNTPYASRSASSGLLQGLLRGGVRRGRSPEINLLSDRELQVFRLLGQGMTGRSIANKLGVSSKTIETHQQRMKVKLNVATSALLSHKAAQWLHPAGSSHVHTAPVSERNAAAAGASPRRRGRATPTLLHSGGSLGHAQV